MENKAISMLRTTLNTRDLGGYRTNTGAWTKKRSIFRSDVMKHPSEDDIAFLKRINMTTVIDLRAQEDVVTSPNPLKSEQGFEYINVPIVEGSGVPESVEKVPDSYMRIAEAENIVKAFQVIAAADSGVLIHCTAGKDRTGVVSAILLSLVGVCDSDIVWDYMITKDCNVERFKAVHANFPEIDMNIVIPKEMYMENFLKLLHEKYGTTENYLMKMGLNATEMEKIKGKLI